MAAAFLVWLLVAAWPAGAAPVPPSPELDARVERRVTAMGTLLAIEVEAQTRAEGLRLSEEIVREVERVEARLSSWRPDSELSRLNRAPVGQPFALGSELASELALCAALFAETGGAFDPGVGGALRALGLRDAPRDDEALGRVRGVGFADLDLALDREPPTATRRDARLSLDAGAFGKGVALDRALARVAGEARAVVLDFGGQVALSGAERSFALADPRERGRVALEVRLEQGSLATTSTSERGEHVVDPATGRPAAGNGSLSVWSSSATRADALSTALFVMGPERALAFAETAPDALAVALVPVGDTLEARVSAGLAERVRVVAADARLFVHPERGRPDGIAR